MGPIIAHRSSISNPTDGARLTRSARGPDKIAGIDGAVRVLASLSLRIFRLRGSVVIRALVGNPQRGDPADTLDRLRHRRGTELRSAAGRVRNDRRRRAIRHSASNDRRRIERRRTRVAFRRHRVRPCARVPLDRHDDPALAYRSHHPRDPGARRQSHQHRAYSPAVGRIVHRRWSGLRQAHGHQSSTSPWHRRSSSISCVPAGSWRRTAPAACC